MRFRHLVTLVLGNAGRCAAIVAVAVLAVCGTYSQTASPQASAPGPAAQAAQAEPSAIIRAISNLVVLDVVVTDRGNPVHGLPQSQFHLRENGHDQTISSFEEHTPQPATTAGPAGSAIEAEAQTPLSPGTYTNLPEFGRATAQNVLLLDALNTPLGDQMRVRSEMIAYLKTIPPGTHMAIFALTTRLRMIEGFTTDASLLAKAIGSAKAGPQQSAMLDPQSDGQLASTTTGLVSTGGGPLSGSGSTGTGMDAVSAMQQFQADLTAAQTDQRVAYTIDAMQQLARYLSAIPGRKNLIWFSGSFPIDLAPDDSLSSPFEASRNYGQDLQETGRLLSAARVAVYPVDARGLMTSAIYDASYGPQSNLMAGSSMSGSSGKRGGGRTPGRGAGGIGSTVNSAEQAAMRQQMAEQASMEQIAAETGGRAFLNSNDLKGAIGNVIQNGSSYYTLAYVPSNTSLDGKFHKMEVKLANSSYKLEYRPGYYATDPAQTKAPPATAVGTVSMMVAAALHGAPASTQIVFKATVLEAASPAVVTVTAAAANKPVLDKPAGEMTSALKGPVHRYAIRLRLQTRDLAFLRSADGKVHAQVEFALVAFDADGKRLNYLDAGQGLTLKPDQYEIALHTGLPSQTQIDLPEGQIYLRIAVRDLLTNRVGSLEVPVTVGGKAHS